MKPAKPSHSTQVAAHQEEMYKQHNTHPQWAVATATQQLYQAEMQCYDAIFVQLNHQLTRSNT